MAVIKDHFDVQAILQTAVAPRASFGINNFLVDDDQIPLDTRFRYVTKSSWDTDLTSTTVPYDYSNVFFGQKRIADKLMLGRWAKNATSPYWVAGSSYEKDYEVWKLVTDGSFKVVDNTTPTALEDEVTATDLSSITDITQVPSVLTAKIQAIVAPNITGLDTSEFKFDSLGRLTLVMSTSGSTAKSVHIEAISPSVGTDLAVAFMDSANGKTVAGIDAEAPEDALAAISQLDDSYYNVQIRGESIAQATSLATYIEGKEKLLDLFVTDANAKDSGATTDIGYILFQLSTKRTMTIYTEHTDEYPDAAVAGAVLPAQEGTTSFAYENLSLVSDSGLTQPLTVTERSALADKGYTWIETIGTNTYLYDGITVGNEEKRIMLGRDWFVARIQEDLFTYQLNVPLAAFDNPTLTAIEGIIWNIANQAIDRKILVNTATRPFTVTLPDADSIDPTTRATHKLEVFDAFQGYINSAINDYKIVGTWTL
jgi:hypothetical protein